MQASFCRQGPSYRRHCHESSDVARCQPVGAAAASQRSSSVTHGPATHLVHCRQGARVAVGRLACTQRHGGNHGSADVHSKHASHGLQVEGRQSVSRVDYKGKAGLAVRQRDRHMQGSCCCLQQPPRTAAAAALPPPVPPLASCSVLLSGQPSHALVSTPQHSGDARMLKQPSI